MLAAAMLTYARGVDMLTDALADTPLAGLPRPVIFGLALCPPAVLGRCATKHALELALVPALEPTQRRNFVPQGRYALGKRIGKGSFGA